MKPVIRWVEPFAYQAGDPFRVMPVGTFKRGERTLEITPDTLREMASNYDAGRPRWRIPIYAGHPTEKNPDPPKVGNAQKLIVKDDGLYAVPEYTDEGKKLIDGGGYQMVSPGVLWSKNGSEYTDEHGIKFDNVIEHIALTNRPFFGSQTQLFAADSSLLDTYMDKQNHMLATAMGLLNKLKDMLTTIVAEEAAEPDEALQTADNPMMTTCPMCHEIMTPDENGKCAKCGADMGMSVPPVAPQGKIATMSADATKSDTFKDYSADQRHDMAKKGEAMPDGSYPIADGGDLQNAIHAVGRGNAPHEDIKKYIIKRAKALGKEEMLPDEWKSGGDKKSQGEPHMADTPTAQTFSVSAEEFAALKERADKVDALESKVKDITTQAETFATQLLTEKKQRRHDQLVVECETFMAIPAKKTDLVDKFQALEEKDPDLFKFFMETLHAADQALSQAGLFTQLSSERTGGVETFADAVESVLKSDFAGDRTKYGDAMRVTATKFPELANEYKAAPAKR